MIFYQLFIRKEAKKTLKNLPRKERNRITEKIILLADNPNNIHLDIRLLEGSSCYRLRVGKWRVIFSRDDNIKIIAIEKIKPRGDAYK